MGIPSFNWLTNVYWVFKVLCSWVQVNDVHRSLGGMTLFDHSTAVGRLEEEGNKEDTVAVSFLDFTFPQPAGPITICPYLMLPLDLLFQFSAGLG